MWLLVRVSTQFFRCTELNTSPVQQFLNVSLLFCALPAMTLFLHSTYQYHATPNLTAVAPVLEFPDLELDLSLGDSTPPISNFTSDYSKCWEGNSLRRVDVYYLCVVSTESRSFETSNVLKVIPISYRNTFQYLQKKNPYSRDTKQSAVCAQEVKFVILMT